MSLSSLQDSLTKKTFELSSLSQQCISLKHSLWESSAKKQYLLQKLEESKTPWNCEVYLSELKSKFDRCKGSCLEKVLSSLIKAYQTYQRTSQSLSFQTSVKEELISTYQQITVSLSQEINLKQRLSALQNTLIDKEKTAEDLKNKLASILTEFNTLKTNLDTGVVKTLLQERVNLKHELEKALETQSLLSFEIEKTDQLIETEKNISRVTPEVANKVLKQKIKEVETEVADYVQKIRNRERVRDKVKGEMKGRPSLKSPNKSLCSEPARQKAFTPKTRPGQMFSCESTPACKFSERNSGLMGMSADRAEVVLKPFRSDSQSFASKIVQLNRGGYFK